MAIVINVPKDTRYGDLGKGAGGVLGAVIAGKEKDKDAQVIADVRSGAPESKALATVSPKNRSAVLAAGAAYRADNPKQTFFNVDQSGKATDTVQSRQAPEGYVSSEQAKFNQERKPSDKALALKDIRATQIDNNPAFEGKDEATKNRVARNIANQAVDLGRFNKNLYDKLGDLTGDNRIRVDRRSTYYTDFLRGANGEKLMVDKNRAFTMAKKRAEQDLRDFKKAQLSNPTLTPEDFFANGAPEQVAKTDKPQETPGFVDTTIQEVKDFLSSLGQGTPAQANDQQFQEQAPVTTPTDPVIQPPEVRVQEATDAAINVDYPIQDQEQWIDVGENLPLVPQSMMDVVRTGNAAAIAPVYASMAGIPLSVALAILQQNANKMPIESLVETKVIPDPISDPGVVPPLTAEQQNQAAGGNNAPVSVAPPGNNPFPSNKQIVK